MAIIFEFVSKNILEIKRFHYQVLRGGNVLFQLDLPERAGLDHWTID
jgi:hypothetical protein